MKIFTETQVKNAIAKLFKENDKRFVCDATDEGGLLKPYDIGYNEGQHDGYVDVLHELGIETREEYLG